MKDKERFQWYAKDVAYKYGIPFPIFWSMLNQESGWNPKARSHVGAVGIAQFMPQTAKALHCDPHNPYSAIDCSARYLQLQYKRTGSWKLALAAYNAGWGAVKKHGGVPPYSETQHYVRTILSVANAKFSKNS